MTIIMIFITEKTFPQKAYRRMKSINMVNFYLQTEN